MERRGQVAIEYMMLIGVLLILIAFLAGYAIMMYNETISTTQFHSSTRNLADSINNVYYLGNGNSMALDFIIPTNVISIAFQDNSIETQITSFGTITNDLIIVDTNVMGSIPIIIGTHKVLVKNINGDVNVSVI